MSCCSRPELDHILFLLQADKNNSWKALETILAEGVFVTVHLTVTKDNASKAMEVLERIHSLGVQSISLTSADSQLPVSDLQNKAASLGLTLKHDLPVPYSANHPVALETAEDNIPDGAGKTWLYVEPDGDVLPSQGMAAQILGNALHDPWEKIYHPK